MTSRERMRMTLDHRVPDRVPCHMNATTWIKNELTTACGVSNDRELLDCLHVDTWDMRGIDIRNGTMPRYAGPEHPVLDANWRGNILHVWGLKEKVVETPFGNLYEQEDYPLRGASSLEELKSYPWPDPDWFDYSDLKNRLTPWADRSIIASGGSVWQHPSYVRGLDVLMIDMAVDPELAVYVFDRFTEFYLAFFDRISASGRRAHRLLRAGRRSGHADRTDDQPRHVRRVYLAAYPKVCRSGALLREQTDFSL